SKCGGKHDNGKAFNRALIRAFRRLKSGLLFEVESTGAFASKPAPTGERISKCGGKHDNGKAFNRALIRAFSRLKSGL
ncbi:hypothetical protein C3E98_045100, partial [Pseudomonas sp. MWU13-2625]